MSKFQKVMSKFQKQLIGMDACPEAIQWVGDRTLHEAWAECVCGDWMIWLLCRATFTKEVMVAIACDCAERVLKHVHDGEDRPRKAIETARAWVRGEATEEDCLEAAEAAAAAAGAAAWAAARAARAAARAVWAVEAVQAAAWAARPTEAAPSAERSAQAEIIRNYVTADELKTVLFLEVSDG